MSESWTPQDSVEVVVRFEASTLEDVIETGALQMNGDRFFVRHPLPKPAGTRVIASRSSWPT